MIDGAQHAGRRNLNCWHTITQFLQMQIESCVQKGITWLGKRSCHHNPLLSLLDSLAVGSPDLML